MPNTLRKLLGDNAKAIRKAKGISQADVVAEAKRLGYKIDQTTVGRIERAKYPSKVETIEVLAKGLRVEPWQLFVPDLVPNALPVAVPGRPTEEDIKKVERVKEVVAQLTPAQRELFVNSDEGKALVPHFPVEKMDSKAWSAASKNASRKTIR